MIRPGVLRSRVSAVRLLDEGGVELRSSARVGGGVVAVVKKLFCARIDVATENVSIQKIKSIVFHIEYASARFYSKNQFPSKSFNPPGSFSSTKHRT